MKVGGSWRNRQKGSSMSNYSNNSQPAPKTAEQQSQPKKTDR